VLKYAILDIDGVLADCRPRLHWVMRDQPDYETFYALVGDDEALRAGCVLATCLAQCLDIIYLTGRDEVCRDQTELWLHRNDLPDGDLLMRAHGDHRKSAPQKLEQLAMLNRQDVELVVDDDPDVCLALTEAGYPVLQARWGHQAVGDDLFRQRRQPDGRVV
jgi:hypothetical protein